MSTKSEQSQQSITSIERADRRNDLEPRRAPHWKRIAEGRYIGYRFMTRGSAGTWLARAYNPDKAFDAVSAVIHIPVDKDHRARDISLANGALAHFKAQARNKLPGADLSTQADGSEWTGNAQEKHMRGGEGGGPAESDQRVLVAPFDDYRLAEGARQSFRRGGLRPAKFRS